MNDRWYERLDISEALEAAGWTADPDNPLEILRKGDAVWAISNDCGDSQLDAAGGSVVFPSDVPAAVVIAACLAASNDTPPAPSPLWAAARYSVAWLDEANGRGEQETAMRLMKLVEEAGEVMQAYIGMVGQNPRKGVTHKREDVAAELCDVMLTAAVALHRFADDPETVMAEHAARVVRRIGALGGGA
ncbi:MazG-like family protein [Streptomyces hygroscopicus]|uniref:MazG-like family protein n=1 Tax=Streptomyces hygroscopicus TaxID=1912 RepID=UPI0037F798B8